MEDSHTSPLFVLSLCLSAALFSTTMAAQPAPASAPSSLPTPAPVSLPSVLFNLTEILQKSGQYTVLMGLLTRTRMGDTLANELNNSYQGLTFFTPTDGAFAGLQQGFLSNLTTDQLATLINAHVVPHFFTWDDFRTVGSPQPTQASAPTGPYNLYFTYLSNQQVNVSTGLVDTIFTHAVNLTKPLAMYQVDKVLLPKDFAAPSSPPKSSPPSAEAPSSEGAPGSARPKAPGSAAAEAPGSTSFQTGSATVSVRGQSALKGGLLAVIGLACVGLAM